MSLISKIQLINRNLISDNRGWFLKIIDGYEVNLPSFTGEIYATSAKIGQSKGGHYHIDANEWFTLITGTCELILYDIDTLEKCKILLDSNSPKTVFVPKRVAHLFVNTGNVDFLLLAYTDKLYDPLDTISYDLSSLKF
jgi:dTDP-4-dehydrorhamnose 3,5-epimerase-like enzyme